MGLACLKSDYTVFYQCSNGTTIIIAMYVDDMLLLSNSLRSVEEFKRKLTTKFEITDLGDAHWILNMEVIENNAPFPCPSDSTLKTSSGAMGCLSIALSALQLLPTSS